MVNGVKTAISEGRKESPDVTIASLVFEVTRPRVQRMRLQQVLDNPENRNIDYVVDNAFRS